jgi:hypothetical protein
MDTERGALRRSRPDAGLGASGKRMGRTWPGTESAPDRVMSDASDLPAKDVDAADSFADHSVGRSGKPDDDGADDLSSGGGWPLRALGRRATWRFFVQKGGRRS